MCFLAASPRGPPGVTNARVIPPPSVSHFLHRLASSAEVKHSHAHPPRRCIIPSVAYQSFPLPLSGLFHRNFNFGGALARLMQFRFLAPPARRKQRLSRLGPKTPASGVSPSVTRSCLLLHGVVRLINYLPRPAACEPESRCRRRRRRPPSFCLFLGSL